jgi:UDPglucose 6-dehydrogenase/GDP-mannose 6-dehydrogenase
MRIAVVGAGYVGLVTGVCLAAKAHDVTCVDVNRSIVERLNAGEPTIYERGLPRLLGEVLAAGRFRATHDLRDAVERANMVIIAVGTPSDRGVIDLTHVRAAAREVGTLLRQTKDFVSIIVKSTVVPGTTDTIVRQELEHASGKLLGDFGLGMNPEFLREGDAIADFMSPDRIVLGYEVREAREQLQELYSPWEVDKLFCNTRTAELIKYANNALLATQISTMNEIANLAAALGGIDVMDVVSGVSLDRRWNPLIEGKRANPGILSYLVPGCGFGGSCFPKDVQALRSQGQGAGLPMHLLNAVLEVNDAQPSQVSDILEREAGPLRGKSVLLLGLAFKPGTDDVRESASLKIADTLLDRGAAVSAHDPIAVEPFKTSFGSRASEIEFVTDWQAALARVDVVIVATRWEEYEVVPSFTGVDSVVFDARRMFSPKEVEGRYLSIGRRVT